MGFSSSLPSHPLWASWLSANLPFLKEGKALEYPNHLPHPRELGFQQITLAENVGQSRDWVLSLEDRSRLHIHDFEHRPMLLHRDKYDPSRGPLYAFAHWLTEARSGRFTLDILFGGHRGLWVQRNPPMKRKSSNAS